MAAQVDSTTTFWTDTTVVVGVSYEYRLIRDQLKYPKPDSAVHWWSFGYINTGIRVPPTLRGRILVLVDTTMKDALADELVQYVADVEAEGWTATILYVPRADEFDPSAVSTVRQIIKNELIAGKRDIESIFLVGRVPVPYSGRIAPDGHNDHVGAWPADGMYGDDGGLYTDGTVNSPNTSRPAQANIPGDGKFDQSTFSSPVEIPVGRIDFFNLPEFKQSETELLQAYFKKAHAFRSGSIPVIRRACIDDNFGSYGEAFASSAWRTYQLFGGDTSVKAADWFESLAGPDVYLWAYGCGGGTDVSCSGVCKTTELAIKPVNAIHTQLFGSYFGDWNTTNNLLRSAIAASPTAITSAWVGRPAWYCHHMALGETIGYSLLVSQNNASNINGTIGTYVPNVIFSGASMGIASVGEKSVHIALMGDPTLRAIMEPVPAMNSATANVLPSNKISVSWTPVQDAEGYMVARRVGTRKWSILTPMPISADTLTDSLVNEGPITYRVYACELRSTAAGTYYDLGRPAEAMVITTGVDEYSPILASGPSIQPQPANSMASLRVELPTSSSVLRVSVIDLAGATVWSYALSTVPAGSQQIELPAQQLASGRYTVKVETQSDVSFTPYLVFH